MLDTLGYGFGITQENQVPDVTGDFSDFGPPTIQDAAVRPTNSAQTGAAEIAWSYNKQALSNPPQEECPWWNIVCKTSKAATAAGDFVQSTLLKVTVLIVVVAIAGIFLMSYAQARGVKAA